MPVEKSWEILEHYILKDLLEPKILTFNKKKAPLSDKNRQKGEKFV